MTLPVPMTLSAPMNPATPELPKEGAADPVGDAVRGWLSSLAVNNPKKLSPKLYFQALLSNSDDIIRVGVACALISGSGIPSQLHETLIALSRHGAVRRRLFDYFLSIRRFDEAERILGMAPPEAVDLDGQLMASNMALDYTGQEAAFEALYLRTGEPGFLHRALRAGELAQGWRGQVPHYIRLTMLDPPDQRWPLGLLMCLVKSGRTELADLACESLEKSGGHEVTVDIARAALLNAQRKFEKTLKLLNRILVAKLPRALQREIAHLKALALEGLGRYVEAADMFLQMNDLSDPEKDAPKRFRSEVLARRSLPALTLPPDDKENFFSMLGFPRSGTTLLENVLQSHPQIETIEEAPAFAAVKDVVGRVLDREVEWTAAVALKARELYYHELTRRVSKTHADVFIDKLPILSVQAGFIRRLFPQKRHIFSVRDPRDVVLSCFKQNFSKNMAMDNLVTFEKACELYDFTMSQWFSSFGLDDPQVCYVRYDNLVLQFETEVRRVLQFLGVPWHESVADFARTAEKRAERTPSYQKVRQGLNIGVQSSWRNYEFLFKKAEARLLDKWLKHFGFDAAA